MEGGWQKLKQVINDTATAALNSTTEEAYSDVMESLKAAAHQKHFQGLVHEALKHERLKSAVMTMVTLKGVSEDEDEEQVGMLLILFFTIVISVGLTCCCLRPKSKKIKQTSASGSTIYDEENWFLRAKAVAKMVSEASTAAYIHMHDVPPVPIYRLGVMVYSLGSHRSETLEKKPELLQEEADRFGCLPLEKSRTQELNEYVPFAVMAYDDEDSVRAKLEPCGYELVQFEPDAIVEMPSHFMAYNKFKKVVLVAIKGTTTVEDCVTDILCRAVPFQNGKAHSGMLNAATFVVGRMSPLLEDVFTPLGYRIVVTGHSLGAGTATLTALLLKKHGFADVKCYAFATPPCLTKELALGGRGFITSVTHCDDIVTRASLRNVKALMVAAGALHQEHRRISVTELTKKLQTDEAQKLIFDSASGVELGEEDLFIPGTVVHFHKFHGKYIGHITDGTFHALRRLELSASCVSDHLTSGYEACCKIDNQAHSADISEKCKFPERESGPAKSTGGVQSSCTVA